MELLDIDMSHLVGKRNNINIFSKDRTLLIPALKIITYKDIELLKENRVTLTLDDVVPVSKPSTSKVVEQEEKIDQAVEEIRAVFHDIRNMKKIPIKYIREKIVPTLFIVKESYEILRLFTALQSKDDYTYRHNIAVGAISNLIGTWLKLPEQELLQLTTAALLHDVGKMFVPEEILNKPGPLTDEEFEEMKKHTIYGYEILKETTGINHRQALVALQHHERMDGSGYPYQLQRKQIDLFSRIVAVADVFHSMSSNRIYKARSPFYAVMAEMKREMFSRLDPEITYTFIHQTMRALIGSKVLLNDGREGKIIFVPHNNPTNPLILVNHQFINLQFTRDIRIVQIIE